RSPAGLGGGAEHGGAAWTLVTTHGDIPFVLHEVSLALFRHGVGFLTIAARPTSRTPDAWFDFLHHFRFISGQRAAVVRAERALAPDEAGAASPRATNFSHATQDVPPAGEPPDDPLALPYLEGQWFFFSLNGGGFLARDAPATPFF